MANPVERLVRARLKSAAGADTTAAGAPDYAKMFNRWVLRRIKAKPVEADSSDVKPVKKGLATGGDY